MNFDLQRFVSDRDGPNVRQSFDAAWGDYEYGPWKFTTFYSQPVQLRDLGGKPFQSYGSEDFTFDVVRAQRELFGWATLSAYYARFAQDDARYLSVSGNELRDCFDIRFYASKNGFDGDLEIMEQTGAIGNDGIKAWAIGSLSGYTFSEIGWTPRLWFQFDAALGNSNPRGTVLQTFNPLFPNGYYFTLAGYTGYTNLIHTKPSVTLHPTSSLTVTLAVVAVAGNHGRCGVHPGRGVLCPAQPDGLDTTRGHMASFALAGRSHPTLPLPSRLFILTLGGVIRRAGGHDSDYVGVQFAWGW